MKHEPPPTPLVQPQKVAECQRQHCAGVRCTKAIGHSGAHEFERATGEMFYWT